MAYPADKAPRNVEGTGNTESELYHIRNQLNNVILMFRELTAQLDADAGITDTDYASNIDESTGTTPASKVIPVS